MMIDLHQHDGHLRFSMSYIHLLLPPIIGRRLTLRDTQIVPKTREISEDSRLNNKPCYLAMCRIVPVMVRSYEYR